HERCHFLVARLDELDLAVSPIERAKDPIDAIAGITENPAHTPCVQPLHQEVTNCLSHCRSPRCVTSELDNERAGAWFDAAFSQATLPPLAQANPSAGRPAAASIPAPAPLCLLIP